MKQADNPDTLARISLCDAADQLVLSGQDDDGDPFCVTLNQLLVSELLEDLQLWMNRA